MAKKSTQPKKTYGSKGRAYEKLPFHSPNVPKAVKKEISEKLHSNGITLNHLATFGQAGEWLKWRWDDENECWLIVHSFTPVGDDAPIGLVSYRAKDLVNAIALALWNYTELSESDFESDDDDDF